MNEAELNMQSRKRALIPNKKILECNNDFVNSNEFNQNIKPICTFPKIFKVENTCDIENEFISTYFAPPGECTRSKTIRGSNINPFDLSKPYSEDTFNFRLTCSTPLASNASFKSRSKLQGCWSNEYNYDSGFDTVSVSESILSFASKSNDLAGDVSQESWSTESLDLSLELRQKSNPVKSCPESGYLLPILSESSDNNVLIPQISALTLANILSGNHTLNNKVSMFDCRFPYEYSGGHIMNSVNVYTCQKLLQTLFPVKNQNQNFEEDINKMSTRPKRKLKEDDTIYIFYCEFSSYRGPTLAQCLRGLDRLANSKSRDLYFPHIYVLNKGYNDFFNEYPQFCSPNGYVSMKKNPYLLRNITLPRTQKINRKEQIQYEKDMREADETLKEIICKRTTDTDILLLFSSHTTVGGI